MIAVSALGFILGLGLMVIGIMASADPEGRGGSYILAGVFGLIVAVICLIYLLYRLVVYLLGSN